jgi:hypothetical protein
MVEGVLLTYSWSWALLEKLPIVHPEGVLTEKIEESQRK